jgi:hypothetical protein
MEGISPKYPPAATPAAARSSITNKHPSKDLFALPGLVFSKAFFNGAIRIFII